MRIHCADECDWRSKIENRGFDRFVHVATISADMGADYPLLAVESNSLGKLVAGQSDIHRDVQWPVARNGIRHRAD